MPQQPEREGVWPAASFELVAPSRRHRPVVAHIPHASVTIPADVRAELLVSEPEARAELIRLTDWHTDDLFAWLADHGVTLFVNRLSRLVFDPERFLDPATEPTEAVGQGIVYTRGTRGQPLREPDSRLRARRIEGLYRPYHAALDALVGDMLEAFGECMLIDCHSFPTQPLPSELDPAPDRPDICIGTDVTHTPPELAEALERGFLAEGFAVRRNVPFAGTFVPSGSYGRDRRVSSVMIEVRRGLYVDEATGRRAPGYAHVRQALERAVVASSVLSGRGWAGRQGSSQPPGS